MIQPGMPVKVSRGSQERLATVMDVYRQPIAGIAFWCRLDDGRPILAAAAEVQPLDDEASRRYNAPAEIFGSL